MEPTVQRPAGAVERRLERALVAKVGAFVFVGALALAAVLPGAGAQAAVLVASVETLVPVDLAPVAAPLDLPALLDLPELRAPLAARGVVASFVAEPAAGPDASAPTATAAVPEAPAAAPVAAVAPVVAFAPLPPPEPLVLEGVVLASWYGPGFYGNRTACGQAYTPEILGVAHRLLPCGTPVKITSPAGVTLVVPVIDRGPYIAGRSLDLSNATKLALRCSDLCRVAMTVIL